MALKYPTLAFRLEESKQLKAFKDLVLLRKEVEVLITIWVLYVKNDGFNVFFKFSAFTHLYSILKITRQMWS